MAKSTILSRRQYLRGMLAAGALSPALLSLSGCAELIRAFERACPEDPAESAGVDWTPDILHPMFWGFQDLDVANGAPGPLRIFYPTYEGSPQGAPILKLCFIRYPVVLFLHGRPPCPDATYFRRWNRLPMVLARSGYVVVVPKHEALFPAEEQSPAITYALSVIDWVRNGWQHRRWVDRNAESTAVAGHSWGAILAARVRHARPTISAYVGLSGTWAEFVDPRSVLNGINPPSFFMWGTEGDFEDLDSGGSWQHVPFGKSAAVFQGRHFDYLSPFAGCDFPRGSCNLIELVAAELVALFITRHVPVTFSHARIPPSLIPPTVTLTPKQQFFAGAHLEGIGGIVTREGCSISLRWEDPAETGSRHLGP